MQPARTLTNAFPACGIAVSAATDGIIFRSDVFTASNGEDGDWSKVVDSLPWSETPRRPQGGFGGKGVLVLVNVRLGTNNVNPIYYDSLKACCHPLATV
jgi:cysteine protease ATG4